MEWLLSLTVCTLKRALLAGVTRLKLTGWSESLVLKWKYSNERRKDAWKGGKREEGGYLIHRYLPA